MVCLLFLYGFRGSKNLLQDPRLEALNGNGIWSTEGAGKVEKARTAGTLLEAGTDAFVFQRVALKKRLKGKALIVSAWVNSDIPGAAFIELSDRKGADLRSAAHPGDGRWRLLKLAVQAPKEAELEFRFRVVKGRAYIKEAAVEKGLISSLDPGTGFLPGLETLYKLTGVIAFSAFICVTVFYFRSSNEFFLKTIEAALILLASSAAMLMLERPFNASVTSNIAWTLLAASLLIYAGSRSETHKDKSFLLEVFKRPGSVFTALTIVMLMVSVNALRNNAVREAELAGRAAYLFFLGAAVSITAQRVYGKLKESETRRAGAAHIDPDELGAEGIPQDNFAEIRKTRRRHEGNPYEAQLP